MENIVVVNNFLDDIDYQKLIDILKDKTYEPVHGSGSREKIKNRFFSRHNYEYFFLIHIKEKIEQLFSKKFNLDRHYMHIQEFGKDGGYHVDTDLPNTYTFCLYISDINAEDYEFANGDFLIKIPNTKYILCVEPRNNTGLFFPSTYLHKGMAYNRFFGEKRLCITWKLTEK
jgi:hypothetical protein